MAARHASELELMRFDDDFEGTIRLDEPMARHTTYRIGGPVRAFAEVNSIAALGALLKVCADENLSWFVAGKGSNLLVSDEGYDGVVITLAGEFRSWCFDDEAQHVVVGAGTMLSRLVQEVFHHGYSGMEFAVGTPGTVGGALVQNAGTRKDWLGSRVVSVTTYDAEVGLKRYSASDLSWGYRKSSFLPNEVIVECELKLERAFSGNIHERMSTLLSRRKASQPLEFPSCGSVFRNPEDASAGALIESVGLKGKTCGGACISEKHANFIVNTGNASAEDVLTLIKMAREEVRRRYGIELETEVRFLGFKDNVFEE
ncbi:MAG: UDP-N-acetylmuramate dehydrogenase [Eggerthellaceae bacterium]|nr:UDP-N-acetylmuramate dehydrogenase [Eggerthellaceae bacterium]